MQIVIDISKEMYKDCKVRNTGHYSMYDFSSMIANGTPLPKGHGGLFDAYEIIEQANNMADELDNNFTIADIEKVGTLLESISPIIEADKESEE